MTDFEKLLDFYKNVGVECEINDKGDKGKELTLGSDDENSKIKGYFGFYTTIIFDKNGKFLEQEIYE